MKIRKLAGGIIISGLFVSGASMATAAPVDVPAPGQPVLKSYVCKYAGTPGEGEKLKPGVNPIWVSNSSLGVNGPVEVGQSFADAQGRSLVVIANTSRITPPPPITLCGVVETTAPPTTAPPTTTPPTTVPGSTEPPRTTAPTTAAPPTSDQTSQPAESLTPVNNELAATGSAIPLGAGLGIIALGASMLLASRFGYDV